MEDLDRAVRGIVETLKEHDEQIKGHSEGFDEMRAWADRIEESIENMKADIAHNAAKLEALGNALHSMGKY